MELQIRLIGYSLLILGLVHIGFPKYFKWKTEFASVSLMNRQMMYIHTLFIGIMVFMIGFLCMRFSDELCNTVFGKYITLGIGIFWFLRLVVQFFGYSPKLWKGKMFETTMHIIFAIYWSYLSFIFLWIGLY